MKTLTSHKAWQTMSGTMLFVNLYMKPQKSPHTNAAMISMKLNEKTCTIAYMKAVINKGASHRHVSDFIFVDFSNISLTLLWKYPRQKISSAGPITKSNNVPIIKTLLPLFMS